MEYILKSEALTVVFESFGGALHSIKDKDGLEYLWQGDKQYWSGQAPVLFPICGSLRNDQAKIGNGKITKMLRHGIVRKKEFQCVEKTDDSIVFQIESNEELKEQYPYNFHLRIRYTLEGKTITTKYIVENTSEDEEMPFFIGGHPGFCCPFYDGESYEDYELVFEKKETCDMPTPISETGLIDMKHRTPFLKDQNILQLRHKLFEKDMIILDRLVSRKVTLRGKKHEKGLSLSFKDFPYLMLWSTANKGPFIALEPWIGLSTCSDESDRFEEKRNLQTAKPGENKEYQFDICVL